MGLELSLLICLSTVDSVHRQLYSCWLDLSKAFSTAPPTCTAPPLRPGKKKSWFRIFLKIPEAGCFRDFPFQLFLTMPLKLNKKRGRPIKKVMLCSLALSCWSVGETGCPTVYCLVAQSCLTLLWPYDSCSPPGSSVHGFSQARTLE